MRSDKLESVIKSGKPILTEGAIVERLRRALHVEINSFVANASLLYSDCGRHALSSLWREYIDIAIQNNLEIIVYTPTWRVNAERLKQAGLPDIQQVARDAYEFLNGIRSAYKEANASIYIGGLVGCRGDAYAPKEALTADVAEEFHAPHIKAFAESGIDFLLATTLPALTEALGIARAISRTGIPYGISFVLRPTGTLLDGTFIEDAISEIDASVERLPAGYFANCVHPANFYAALEAANRRCPGIAGRFVGIQGNASRKSPEELDGAACLEADDPVGYARAIHMLYREFGVNVLGGCCGTNGEYIAAVAKQVNK